MSDDDNGDDKPSATRSTRIIALGDQVSNVISSVGAVAVVGVVAYVGETGADGGFIKDVWAAAKTASPFAAMFATLAWLSERQERRKAQEQCQERTISFVESTNQHSTALEKMVDAIRQISGTIVAATSKPQSRKQRRR